MILPTRTDAGRRLAVALERYLDHAPVLLAISPGGVRVGYEVAREFEAPLDIVPARPLTIPGRPEVIIGAIAPGVVHLEQGEIDRLRLPAAYVEHLVEFEQEELERRARFLRDEMPAIPLSDRTAIVVDDGRAAGAVVRTAIEAIRKAGAAHVIFAAPRCPPAITKLIQPLVEDVVLLSGPADRRASMLCDEHFGQTTGADVRRLIERTRSRWRSAGPGVPVVQPKLVSTS